MRLIWASQNLIPLLLRPLRLVMPSERLRSARILILKATHLPFVGAIWSYELLASSRKPNGFSMSGPETPTMSKRFFRSSIQPARSLATGFQASPEENGRMPGRPYQASRPQTRTGPSGDDQLKSLVEKLTVQVAELTSIVSSQQREAKMAA